jgi:hypothetical protein
MVRGVRRRILSRVSFVGSAALALTLALIPLQGDAGAAVSPATDGGDLLAFQTTTLTPAGAARMQAGSYWGGPTTAPTGETFSLLFSDTYPQDPAKTQQWAAFFSSLTHGSELAKLQAYLLPLSEVQQICGRFALACYSPRSSMLVASPDNPAVGVSATGVMAHEYGHHVASNRSDAPWVAVDYGTKRWASYEQVCARAQQGELHPGAEDEENYATNPGEAFAETFRVLNERRLGLPEDPWNIVGENLYPNQQALDLVLEDVVHPWTKGTATSYHGTSGKRYSIPTALDGNASVRLVAAKKARFTLRVGGAAATTTTAGGTRLVSLTICGKRTLSVSVKRISGTGGYTLTVAKP